MTELKESTQHIGKNVLKLLISEKAFKENERYQAAIQSSNVEMYEYIQHKEVLEIAGADYIVKGFDHVKKNFESGFYSKMFKI